MPSHPETAFAAGTMALALVFYGACDKRLSGPDRKTILAGSVAVPAVKSAPRKAVAAPAVSASSAPQSQDPCTVTFKDPTPEFTENTVTIDFGRKTLTYQTSDEVESIETTPFAALQEPDQKAFLRKAAQENKVPAHCLKGTGL